MFGEAFRGSDFKFGGLGFGEFSRQAGKIYIKKIGVDVFCGNSFYSLKVKVFRGVKVFSGSYISKI